MCGMDPTADVARKRLKSGEYFRADHVRRDMRHLLDSLEHHVKSSGGFLLWDEGSMLREIARQYGVEWPDGL